MSPRRAGGAVVLTSVRRYPYVSHLICNAGCAFWSGVSKFIACKQILQQGLSLAITIPEFKLTIPPGRGQLTTIEGLMRDIITDLGADQPLRRIQSPATYEKIESILERCTRCHYMVR